MSGSTLRATNSASDTDVAALAEAQREPGFLRLRFPAALESKYRSDQQRASWVLRMAVALCYLALLGASHWVLPLVGGHSIEMLQLPGALLYGLILPMLLLTAVTAAIPPLRGGSDGMLLASMLVVTVATAGLMVLEHERQPVMLPPTASLTYLISAWLLLRPPVTLALMLSAVSLAGATGLFIYVDWGQAHLMPDLVLMLLLVLPVVVSALVADRDARRLWLSQQLLATSARLDYLTGLLNRRTFEADATEALRRASRNGTPSALLLLDIDFFKSINDLYGHARGDQVLKDIAGAVGRAGRQPTDLCARYGGEEFAILWTDCGATAAKRSAETLLLEVRRLGIENRGSKVAEVVTASAGLIVWESEPVGDIQDAINRADHLLYMAKRSGRNRLVTLKAAQETPAPAA